MLKLSTILVVLTAFLINAQNNLDFEFDYAQFSYDSTSNFVEFYYSLNQASLKLVDQDSVPKIEGLLKIFILNPKTGDTLVNNQWLLRHEIKDTTDMVNQSLVGTLGFILPAGKLTCEITGMDIHDNEHSRKIVENIEVIPFAKTNISISDIQLASNIIQDSPNTKSIFYKNTFEVLPIPNLVFSKSQPVLFFYTELYNLQSQNAKSSNLKLNELIYNSRGKIIKEKSKNIARNTNSRVEVGTFVLSNYPTDTYTIALALIDSAGSQGITTSKKFYLYNPDVQPTDTFDVATTSSISSMFGAMSEEEIDDLYAKSKYIASSAEIDKFEKLGNLEGKRTFMDQFWKMRDDNPSTPENEFFKEYLQRINYVDQKFGAMGRIGWKTDRGRVYLIYGEPSEVERYPNQLESKPYEIWRYNNIEGGVYFVFADLTGFSNYQLMHSTKRGELSDENWENRITVN